MLYRARLVKIMLDKVAKIKRPGVIEMDVVERNLILQRAIEVYGVRAQEDMLMENCIEFIKAILERRRATDVIEIMHLEAAIREKTADVQIGLDQTKITYGSPEAEEEYKLNRLSKGCVGRIGWREAVTKDNIR